MAEQKQLDGLPEEPREKPYVYPTWITKLLGGDSKCWYAPWYKAHFKYAKRKDRDAIMDEYTVAHDKIVATRAAELKAAGYLVKVEKEGSFRINGAAGDVSGIPDVVGMKGDEALISEAKSGKPRASDHWQVLIYKLLLPKHWLKGFTKIRGEVVYREGEPIPVKPATAKENEAIGAAFRRVMGNTPPEAAPSGNECRFCDVARCAYRVDEADGDSGGMF